MTCDFRIPQILPAFGNEAKYTFGEKEEIKKHLREDITFKNLNVSEDEFFEEIANTFANSAYTGKKISTLCVLFVRSYTKEASRKNYMTRFAEKDAEIKLVLEKARQLMRKLRQCINDVEGHRKTSRL